ncbi:hypothetical protein [Streptomyces sp. NPDC050856]|uniref:hypothetical protein n=1 Tax=Streptomyces sp. NPDC050856 TaxID=3154939 RepID=UPI0033C28817
MGSEGHRTVRRPQEAGQGPAPEPECPSCGQPVGTAIKRRKILGAWVPVWRPRPCHNPECARYQRESSADEPGKSGETG